MEPNFFLCPVILLLKPDQGCVVFYHRAHPWGMGRKVLLAWTLIMRDEHPVDREAGAPLLTGVEFCSTVQWPTCGDVYGHACLPELCFFSFLRVEVPAFDCPLRLAGCGAGLGQLCPGDLEFCTCQYWGGAPATASASSRTLAITTALPQALFILLCLPVPALLSAHSMVLESLPAWVWSVSHAA